MRIKFLCMHYLNLTSLLFHLCECVCVCVCVCVCARAMKSTLILHSPAGKSLAVNIAVN